MRGLQIRIIIRLFIIVIMQAIAELLLDYYLDLPGNLIKLPVRNQIVPERKNFTGLNTMKILLINGPNMQLLGKREPEIYGKETLNDMHVKIAKFSESLHVETEFFQSNHEGEIVDKIGNVEKDIDGIIINPAAYSHTSVAIHDAIKGIPQPVVEVHLTNIHKRENFRHTSLTAPACEGQICGFGTSGYKLALEAIIELINSA